MTQPEFLLTSLIVILTPGTGAIFTVSTALQYGWRASLVAAIGCTASIVPHLLASIFGLSFVLHQSALAFQVLKLAGVAYLLYLAWSMWRDSSLLSVETVNAPYVTTQVVWQAILINLLNPKLTLFFVAFFPLFISPSSTPQTAQLLQLGTVFMLLTLLVFAAYGILASVICQRLLASTRVVTGLRRTFALMIAALGLRLAVLE